MLHMLTRLVFHMVGEEIWHRNETSFSFVLRFYNNNLYYQFVLIWKAGFDIPLSPHGWEVDKKTSKELS